MEVNFYSPELKLIGVMENHTSLQWNRKFYEPGDFELHCPLQPYNMSLCALENIISFDGAIEAGVIESVNVVQSYNNSEITIKGRFLSSYMDRRLIRPTYNFTGLVETAMREILTNAVPIPLVELGAIKGFTEEVTFQATYKNLMLYETKLSRSSNIGYRFTPDFTARKIVFDLYKGVDRSLQQNARSQIVFAEGYDNVESANWSINSQIYKTVGYVGGKGEGSERTFVQVGDDSLAGLERREYFVSATDVQDKDISKAEYEAALRERGESKLFEASLADSFECQTIADGNFRYRKDYDLGDIVTVQKESWGMQKHLMITEVKEIYEQKAVVIEPTFGTTLPTTVDWRDN